MQELIKKILLENNLELKEINFQFPIFFSYFKEKKEDYFIMIFLNYDELIQLNKGQSELEDEKKNLEYLLNAIIEEIRKTHLLEFNFKNLDYNLSTILFLNLEEHSEYILNELHKIEENYRVAKKYILPYKLIDLERITEKLTGSENIIYDLNKISIENNNLLNNKDESWYRLLMNLFIKIPILNFQPLNDKEQLKNISNEIKNDLNPFQKEVLESIINEYNENVDIDVFLDSNNYFEINDNE